MDVVTKAYILDALLRFLISSSPFALIGGLYYAAQRKRKITKEADKIGVDAAAVLSNEALAWIKEAREMATEANMRSDVLEHRLDSCEGELRETEQKIRSLERDKAHLTRVVKSLARYIVLLQQFVLDNDLVPPIPSYKVRNALEQYGNEEGDE